MVRYKKLKLESTFDGKNIKIPRKKMIVREELLFSCFPNGLTHDFTTSCTFLAWIMENSGSLTTITISTVRFLEIEPKTNLERCGINSNTCSPVAHGGTCMN